MILGFSCSVFYRFLLSKGSFSPTHTPYSKLSISHHNSYKSSYSFKIKPNKPTYYHPNKLDVNIVQFW